MNPYILLAIAAAWVSSVGGSFWYGTSVGRDGEVARQTEVSTVIEQTRRAAQEGAADAISQIKITNTTVRAKTETVVRENVVYRDCVNPDSGVRLINEALTGRSQPPGDSVVPGVNTVN